MTKIIKTNVARLLDKAKIAYELVPYEVDENDLSAQHIADQLGEDINRVFKTLVLHGDKVKHIVCVVPGCREVDLKKAARASGNKKVEMLLMKDLLPTTGYIRGGCSPIGMKKQFTTVIHNNAQNAQIIFFSGGRVGCQVSLSPVDLEKVIHLKYADITKDT